MVLAVDDGVTGAPLYHRLVTSRWHPRRWWPPLWAVTKDLRREYGEDDVTDLAAGVTFWTIFAIPPAILAFTQFLGLLGPIFGEELRDDARRQALDFVEREIGDNPDLLKAVSSLFDQGGAGLFVVSVALALWAMSRGFAGVVRALDRAYDLDDERSWLSVRVTALGLAVGSIAVSTLAVAVLIIGPAFGRGEAVAARIGLGDAFATVWDVARGPVIVVVLVLWTATIFHIGPDHHTPWRWDLPGAVLAGVLWLVLFIGFGYYVRFAAGSLTGLVGALLLGLTWIWLMALFLLLGAELNSVLVEHWDVPVDRRPDLTDRTVRWGWARIRHLPLLRRFDGPGSLPAAEAAEEAPHDVAVGDAGQRAVDPVVGEPVDHEAGPEELVVDDLHPPVEREA
jgi:membrane protein